MKNLLIVLVILFLGCSKKETENINVYQITVTYIGPRDAPPPEIVLKNSKPNENVFPVTNYQIEKEDLMKIEEICYSEKRENVKNSLVMVKVNKDNQIKKYFFNKKNGIKILDKIQKLTSHYNNERLDDDFYSLILITKHNWYRDGKIIGT
ncbi:hypothetical protein QFZ37_000856 [Chryseobacterium ginsenosidimutans]|uniref:hypothetical protein n=1 Tax=Chryseobacterium ginsenosidimutans TaxID=687846 RepID=UPI00278318C5|nr:hypothetical protein [Chryseobacterium ginsenosidimutans]MDQ0592487.1 hypothetical protein [Chryseobacterium ginsenosidimutans]